MDLSKDLDLVCEAVYGAKELGFSKLLVSDRFMEFLKSVPREGDGVELWSETRELKGDVMCLMGVYIYSSKEDYGNHKS